MSDQAQILVAIDCPAGDAETTGGAVLGWLVEQGIVERDLKDCALGNDGLGHPPGPNLDAAVEGDTSTAHKLRTNGLDIVTTRTAFDTGGNGIELQCVKCSGTFEPTDDWMQAIGAWAEGDDGASYQCPSCGHEQALRDWTGPWAWGFGHLGFKFWNWPPLKAEFIAALESRVAGRVRLVCQHV